MNKRTVGIILTSVPAAVLVAGAGMMIARRIRSRKTPAGAGEAERPEESETEAQSCRAASGESVRNKRTVRIILASVLAAVLVVSVGMTIAQQIRSRKTLADAEEAARLAGLQTESQYTETAPPVEEPSEGPTEEPLPEEALELAGLDLEALRAVNKDVVGWISIPGTIVSYPLIQGKDNQYYLRRNWKKQSISSGSIFLEAEVSRDLTDFHTIVYGHRMRNETMFGTIKYYSKADYWREHPSIYIVLDDTIYRYDIFAAYEAAVDGIVYRLDIEEKHLEEEFIQYCKDHSVLDTGLAPAAGDRILTLSTCTSNLSETYRWVVHGVLAQEYSRANI